MTSTSRDDGFVHTGPGTVAGRYLRRFWQPVYVSRALAAGQAVPIRIMSEDFTLYRGESGTPHLVGHRCPHRRTQLSTGWVEGETIRCLFHGWRFDEAGHCVEQPAEPEPFCDKVAIASYPTREQLGLVFGYFGEGEPPPLASWPELDAGLMRKSSMERLPCNFFQSAENIMDDVHVRFAHRGAGQLGVSRRAGIHRVSASETSFGLTQYLEHEGVVERNHFVMPNICYLVVADYSKAVNVPVQHLFWYVPIDDMTHYHVRVDAVGVSARPSPPGGPQWTNAPASPAGTADVHDAILAVLQGRQRLSDFANHPELVRIQDGVTITGQGVIADRSAERLGRTDAAVILLRKLWSRELRALSRGDALTGFRRPDDFGELARRAPAGHARPAASTVAGAGDPS